jgi:hypothetical protein
MKKHLLSILLALALISGHLGGCEAHYRKKDKK